MGVLQDIVLLLRGSCHEKGDSQMTEDKVWGPVGSVVADTTSVTPDLFAGELDSMGRLLHDLSGRLARHALRVQDLQLAVKHAADEARALAAAMASNPAVREAGYHTHLISLSVDLSRALEKLDERCAR